MAVIDPPWLRIAWDEVLKGIHEVRGPEHHPRILKYHDATELRATTDEIPWCSSFVNWVFRELGMPRTNSAAARSWLEWGGMAPQIPPYGCVVILKRGGAGEPGPEVLDAKGHVGFFVGYASPQEILSLGGNQSDAVNVRVYPRIQVLGYRWPR